MSRTGWPQAATRRRPSPSSLRGEWLTECGDAFVGFLLGEELAGLPLEAVVLDRDNWQELPDNLFRRVITAESTGVVPRKEWLPWMEDRGTAGLWAYRTTDADDRHRTTIGSCEFFLRCNRPPQPT